MPETILWGAACVSFVIAVAALSATVATLTAQQTAQIRPTAAVKVRGLASEINTHWARYPGLSDPRDV